MRRLLMRAETELSGNTLTGIGSVFGQAAETPEYGLEAFDRAAFDEVLGDENHEVAALFNHNPDYLLGRQASGTLTLRATDAGLAFSIDLPDTQLGRDVKILAARGDLMGASIGFLPGKTRIDRSANGPVTVHTSVARLRDVSPVTFPAYAGTKGSLSLRMEGVRRVDYRSRLIHIRHDLHTKGK